MIASNSIDQFLSNDENEAESTLINGNEKHENNQENESFNIELKNILESFEFYINDLIDVILCETKSIFESALSPSNSTSHLSQENNNGDELRRKTKNPHRLNFMISKIIKIHKTKLNKNLQSRIENIKKLAKSSTNELDLDVDMIILHLSAILEKFETFLRSLLDKLNEINSNSSEDSENESIHHRYTDFSSDTESYYASKHIKKKRLKNIAQSFNNNGKNLLDYELNDETTSIHSLEHVASEAEIDNLNLSNSSPLTKKPFEIFSQVNANDIEDTTSFKSLDFNNENYNADEEEIENSTLNDTLSLSENMSEKSFILIDDENENPNQDIRDYQSESNHKKIKNLIQKSKLINISHNSLDQVYAGMKVLALKNKKRHIWKMATILNVENPVKDDKLKDYDVICNCSYKIRFETDFDEEDCGGYKYSDDLVNYVVSDSDEDERESIADSVNQDEASENNDDEEVLCLDDDYLAKNDDCLKRKLNSENPKFVKKKTSCNAISILDAKCLAYINNYEKFLPNNFDANIGKSKKSYKSNEQEFILQPKSRVVSYYQLLIKDKNKIIINNEYLTSGTIVELPSLHNLNRYLIFFDNGLCSYVKPSLVYPIFDLFGMPLDRLHMDHAQFMKNYFDKHPERTMVKFNKSNKVNVFLANKWYVCTVLDTDLSLVKLEFKNVILNKENNKKSTFNMWMYRGSFRLQPLFNNFIDEFKKLNKDAAKMSLLSPYHLYIRDKYTSYIGQYDKGNHYISMFASSLFPDVESKIFTSKRVALKNTAARAINSNDQELAEQSKTTNINHGQVKHLDLQSLIRDEVIVYYPHACTISCVNRYEENLDFINHVNPLLIPMMHGWQRQIHHQSRAALNNIRKRVNYVAPCGRMLRTITEVDKYLAMTDSKITLDKFSFDIYIHTDREFEGKTKGLKIEDIAAGKEPMPISCVNSVDDEIPEKFEYSSERTPLVGVPLIIDESTMDGCDCTDGCRDRMKCSCWRKTFEATQYADGNQINYNVGYRGRRLNDMVKTGIFECNSNCKCDHRCGNRVVQNGLTVRLQLFRTIGKGWGLRCLDDIAKGTFICTYVGHILTEGILIFTL
jgi:hypothetical protein